jgi:hypothetical protein
MKNAFYLVAALLGLIAAARADVPAPAQLLPADTLFVLTAPDWAQAAAQLKQSPQSKLWDDPAMRPFRERFMARFHAEVLKPLEKELGISFADYLELAQGQVTLAVTRGEWDGRSEAMPGFLLLMDAREQSEPLRTRLAEVRKKLADAGKPMKSERIRDVELTTVTVQLEELEATLSKAFPPADPDEDEEESAPKPSRKIDLTFGQSKSLLVVGTRVQDLEKVLARQSGGLAPALADQAAFEQSQARFRGALGYGWLNFKTIYEVMEKQAIEAGKAFAAQNPMGIDPSRALVALGLNGLNAVGFSWSEHPEGSFGEVTLSVPESARAGIFKILSVEARDAAPPGFVPADVVKFNRLRVDGQKAWTVFEGMLNSFSPQFGGLLQMGMAAAGKDKDPDFDLKRNLIGNLGDDFIMLEKKPRSTRLEDLSEPPSLVLVGSPNSEQLVQAVRTASATVAMMLGAADVREREFQGRKIFSIPLPSFPTGEDEPAPERSFHFAASGSYAAFSQDAAMLEEYLRNSDSGARPLREMAGLSEAAQKVGGMGNGFFGFENQRETTRTTLEASRQNAALLEKLIAAEGGEIDSLKGWFDFTVLPNFEQIARYFHYAVAGLENSPNGLTFKLFAPTPPQMKK